MGVHNVLRLNNRIGSGPPPVVFSHWGLLALVFAVALAVCSLSVLSYAESPTTPAPSGPAAGTQGGTTPSQPETEKTPPEPPDEVTKLKQQIVKAQNEGSLGFRKRILCSAVQGYGLYSPLKAGVPTTGIILYVEPANYGTMVGSDRYVIDCVVDIAVLGAGGKLLHEKKGKLNYVSRSPVLDIHFAVGLQLKKPLEKTVTIKTILHDNIKNERATDTLTLTINPGHGV